MLCLMRYALAEVFFGVIDRPSVYNTYIRSLMHEVKVLYYIYFLRRRKYKRTNKRA